MHCLVENFQISIYEWVEKNYKYHVCRILTEVKTLGIASIFTLFQYYAVQKMQKIPENRTSTSQISNVWDNIYKMNFVFSQTDWPAYCLVLQSTTKATSSTFYNCVDIAYMSESILWLCYYCIYACVHVTIAYMLTLYTCEHYKPVNNTYMRTLRTCEKA